MTKSTLNQIDYTRAFLRAAGMDEELQSKFCIDWWWNHTNLNHLRLSTKGIKFIKKETKIPIHVVEVIHPLLSTHLITLSRINMGPYFLHHRGSEVTLLLINAESATMLNLHAGNLGQYLENLQL